MKKKIKAKQEKKINYHKKRATKKEESLVDSLQRRRKSHLAKENEWINKDLSQCHGKTNGNEKIS